MLKTAIKAANRAGRIALKGFRKDHMISVSYKDMHEPVTKYDRACERCITKILRKRYPHHQIIGEEYGKSGDQESDFRWYIDPIDGTKNYMRKIPFFAVSVGLMYKNKFILGAIDAPALGLFWHGEKGKGAFLNKRRIRVSNTSKMIDTLIGVGWGKSPKILRQGMEIHKKIGRATTRVRGYGSTVLSLGFVACGKLDAYIRNHTRIVDVAAGFAIAQEAGANLTLLNGKPWKKREGEFILSNQAITKKLVKLIGKK